MGMDLGRTIGALVTLAGVGLLSAEAAAETFEFLSYTPPAGWTAGQTREGKTYTYQDASSAGVVILFNSRPTQLAPAAVFAEEWRARLASVVQAQAPAPQLVREADVTVAVGTAQGAMQGRPVAAVLATLVGRGRALSVVALASGDGGRHVSAFLGSLSVRPTAAPAAEAKQPRDKRRPGRGGVAGLYLSQGFEYRFTPDFSGGSGGSFGTGHATYFYLLSEDGRVARGSGLPNAPDGDIRRFDFDAYRRENPAASGTYAIDGNRVILKMGAGTDLAETFAAPILPDGQLDIKKKKYKRSVRPR
jgi:hypothetical protein